METKVVNKISGRKGTVWQILSALQDLKICMQVRIMGFTINNPHLWAKDVAQ